MLGFVVSFLLRLTSDLQRRGQVPWYSFNTCLSPVQAMLDVAANQGWLVTVLNISNLVQMVIQGRWLKDSSLLTVPNIELHHLHIFR